MILDLVEGKSISRNIFVILMQLIILNSYFLIMNIANEKICSRKQNQWRDVSDLLKLFVLLFKNLHKVFSYFKNYH